MQKCSLTGDRPTGGLASIYWAWYTIDHEREARKVHYCMPCFEAILRPTLVRSLTTPVDDRYDNCLECGVDLTDDGAVIYGKLFAPRSEPVPFELWLCFPHFDAMRSDLGSLGVRLADRQVASAAPLESPWLRLDDLMPAA